MIIKTENFELEISNGSDVYFGSKTHGQIFKKLTEFKQEEKLHLESVQKAAEKLLLESESILLSSKE